MSGALAPAHLAPAHKAEDWRYAASDAMARVWPVEPEEIDVPAGGSDRLTLVQDAAGETAARHIVLRLGAGASFTLTLLNLAGAYGRIEVEAHLAEGAHLAIGGVQMAGAGEALEIVTTLVHAEPGATSRQVIRSVAGAGGRVTYLGRVRVERGADGTDSDQSVRAMLLDRSAEANARPELEIFADDVQCAHGCAVGELDAMGLFYLASRGIAPAEARLLMLRAFVAEALEHRVEKWEPVFHDSDATTGDSEGAEDGSEGNGHVQALVSARLETLVKGVS